MPKGTSSYQAAWIVDAETSDNEEEEEDNSDSESDESMMVSEDNSSVLGCLFQGLGSNMPIWKHLIKCHALELSSPKQF